MNTLEYKEIVQKNGKQTLELKDLSCPFYEKSEKLFETGFVDSKGTKIFQGDILKIDYVDAPAPFFKVMKALGDKVVYLIIQKKKEISVLNYISHNEKVYFTGGKSGYSDIAFFQYLLDKGCVEVIGNIYDDNDKDLYKEITKEKLESKSEKAERWGKAQKEAETTIKEFFENFFDIDIKIDNTKDEQKQNHFLAINFKAKEDIKNTNQILELFKFKYIILKKSLRKEKFPFFEFYKMEINSNDIRVLIEDCYQPYAKERQIIKEALNLK